MLKRTILLLLAAAMLLTMPVCAADSASGTMLTMGHTVVAPGFDVYSRVYAMDEETMQAGYSIELQPDSEVYPIVLACDTMYGGMTLEEITAYAQGLGYNVAAAVNTAFFTSPGIPIGIAVEQGVLRSAADGLNAFAILADGSYYTAHEPKVRFALSSDAWGEESMELQYLNKGMEYEDIYMYTSEFSTVSTRVWENVWAVRLKITEGELSLSGSLTMEVTEVIRSATAVPIGEGNMILTAKKKGAYGDAFSKFKVGDVLTLDTLCEDEVLVSAPYITGCGDILVENGQMTDPAGWSPFVEGSHPRTMMGWRADGTLVMYVADGRSPGYASGLTQQQAAEEMLRQGCVTAVNMDGGGSSVVGVRMPGSDSIEPLNRPSDGKPRQCAAYMLLVTDAAPDGEGVNLHLRENNSYVLPNQRLQLHVFATDRALYPGVTDTTAVRYSADGESFTDGVYTATHRAGVHKITMETDTAAGVGEVRVVCQPTDLTVTMADGTPLGDMTVYNGQRLALDIRASHYGKEILADETCVGYSSSIYLGAPDADGVFTIDALPGSWGLLTMEIGDRSYTIRLRVERSLRDISDFRCKTALDFYKAG